MLEKNSIITISIIAIVLLLAGYFTFSTIRSNYLANQQQSAAAQSLESQEGVYTTLDGTEIDLSTFDGQVRVVNSWASWCPFCVNELTDFSTLATEFADKNVVVLAINRKEKLSLVKAFVDHLSKTEGIVFILDAADHFYGQIGGFSMPETIFYDTEGNVVVHKRGFMDLNEMRTHTEKALLISDELTR